jgi:hypothetical protein
MPANNDMELLVRQKMEEFRIEPPAADWQAIYEKLHPKKDRRFFWWLFPMVAGLLFGGYWIIMQDQSSVPHAKTPALPATKSIAITQSGVDKNQAPLLKDPASSTSLTTKKSIKPSSPLTNSSKRSFTEDEISNSPIHAKQSPAAQGSPADVSHNNIQPTDKEDATSGTKARLEQSPAPAAFTTTEEKQKENAVAPAIESNANELKQNQEENKETTATREDPRKDSLSAPVPPTDQALKTSSIPNLSSHADKGWYLGAYAEIGLNKPTEPITPMKFADMNNSPGSVSSITTADGSTAQGLHYALGLALERKLKKMSFSFGLGIQSNTWSSTSTTYKDSMAAGNFFSRTQISNNSSNYAHVAMELPVMLNFRISGKKHSSYWFTTGLNNAVTLKLNQKTDVSMLQSNASYSQDNSLTSKASSYQPQFRIGFMYENTKDRYHWQLSPFMQYGLNRMVKTGSPDTQLLHFGIQTRYYFKKLK